MDEMITLISKELTWDFLKNDLITIYSETFTEQELKSVIKFYQSPTGKKIVSKTPELMKRSMEMTQKRVMDIIPKLEKIANEIEKK